MKQIKLFSLSILLLIIAVAISNQAHTSFSNPLIDKAMAIASLSFMFASVIFGAGLFLRKKKVAEKKEETAVDFQQYIQLDKKDPKNIKFNGQILKIGENKNDYLVLEKLA